MKRLRMELSYKLTLILLVLQGLSVRAQNNNVPYSLPPNQAGPQAGYSSSPTFNYYVNDPLKGRRIVCLYNNNNYYATKFTPSRIDPTLCTHVNYEFAILDPKTYEVISGNPSLDLQQNFYDEAVDLKKKSPLLKVLLSLGGWDDSTKKYSELVESEQRMNNFVAKAVPFLRSHGFDGLDIAWEYPNCWKGALGISPNDKKNFVTLLQKIRNRFDSENLILSISVSAVKREILKAYDVPAISRLVHHINVMTYDMHGPWEHVTGHHAQFEKEDGDEDPTMNTKTAMDVWSSLGADKLKLNLGVPTYAKTYRLVDPNNHGIRAPTKGAGNPGPLSKQGGFLCYSELCELLDSGNWTEGEDPGHGFYAYSGDQWASYDPPMTMVRKAKYVALNGYGGLLVKDCSCDDFNGKCFSLANPLMRMMRLELIHRLG